MKNILVTGGAGFVGSNRLPSERRAKLAWANLIYDIYSDQAMEPMEQPMPLESIKIHQPAGTYSQPLEYPQTFLSAKKVRLISSSIFDVTIDLKDSRDNKSVDFETLSSGEKQLTYAVSSLALQWKKNNWFDMKELEEVNKIKAVVEYILQQMGVAVDYIHLFKVMYFA